MATVDEMLKIRNAKTGMAERSNAEKLGDMYRRNNAYGGLWWKQGQGTTASGGATNGAAGTPAGTTPAAGPTDAGAPAGGVQTETPAAGGAEIPAAGSAKTPAAGTTGTTGAGAATGTAENSQQALIEQMKSELHKQYATATDQSEMLRKMYEANLAATKAQLESGYNENLSGLEAEREALAQQYQQAQRQTTADADKAKANWNETANAYGLNSGTQGQAQLAMGNQLQSNLTALYQTEMQKRAEIERQKQLLGQQYQNAIQEAQANNDMALAKALYEEAVRLDESITEEGIEQISRFVGLLNGDSSSYSGKSSGYSGGYSGGYGGYYGRSGGSGSSGGSADTSKAYRESWAEIVEAAKNAGYGTSASGIFNYLTTSKRYKEYGLDGRYVKGAVDAYDEFRNTESKTYYVGSKLGKEYLDQLRSGAADSITASDGTTWEIGEDGNAYAISADGRYRQKITEGKNPNAGTGAGGSSGGTGKSGSSGSSGWSSTAQDILNKAATGSNYSANVADRTAAALKSGKITKAEADKLLTAIGY